MVRAGSQVTVNPTDRLGSLDWMTAVIAANDTSDNDLTKPEAWIMCDLRDLVAPCYVFSTVLLNVGIGERICIAVHSMHTLEDVGKGATKYMCMQTCLLSMHASRTCIPKHALQLCAYAQSCEVQHCQQPTQEMMKALAYQFAIVDKTLGCRRTANTQVDVHGVTLSSCVPEHDADYVRVCRI